MLDVPLVEAFHKGELDAFAQAMEGSSAAGGVLGAMKPFLLELAQPQKEGVTSAGAYKRETEKAVETAVARAAVVLREAMLATKNSLIEMLVG